MEVTKSANVKGKRGFAIKNTAGMYDLFKGMTMFVVIVVHTIGLFPINMFSAEEMSDAATVINTLRANPLIVVYYLCTETVMPALFVIGGYGFRKTKIKQCIIRQFKSLMIPYLVTMMLTSIVHLVNHYLFYHYFPGAVKETFKIFMGSLLGLAKTTEYGEYTFFPNGPNWFILALFWGLIIFDILVNYVPEKFMLIVSIGLACVGWLLSLGNTFPFCISQGLISVLFINMGYFVKKKKIFTEGLTVKHWIIYILIGVIPEVVMTYMGDYFGMANDLYRFGMLSIVARGLFSIGFLYVFLLLNALRGPASMFVRHVGHNSIYILCIHTIEMMGFPLYYFANKWNGNLTSGIVLFSVIRLIAVFAICFLFVATKEKLPNIKKWIKEKTMNKDSEKKKYEIKNTAGMFDLHKGIAMIIVMIVHTMGLFPELYNFEMQKTLKMYMAASVVAFTYVLFVETMMPSLLLMSGYTYRKTTVKKSIVKQFKALIVPYLVTMMITTVLHLVFHYAFNRNKATAIIETLKVFFGNLLGLPRTTDYGPYSLFSCGPNWFLLALFWGLIIFNLLLNYVPEKYLPISALGASCIGWLIGLGGVTIPFCITQGLVSVVYICLGYYVKKKKIFIDGPNTKFRKVYIVVVLVGIVAMGFLGDYFGMAEDMYRYGIISIISKALSCVIAVYAILCLNRFRGKISSIIRFAGHYSIYILCIHTIEMKAFPSYVFSDKWHGRSLALGIFVHSISRIVLVFLACYLFVTIKDKVITMIREKKEKAVNV